MLKKKQKLVEKLFPRSRTDTLGHNPLPTNNQPIAVPATKKEDTSDLMGETTMVSMESTSHAGEIKAVAVGEMLEERLFTIRCAPVGDMERTDMEHTTNTTHKPHTADTSNSHRKRRKFKFKNGAVAPQEQT